MSGAASFHETATRYILPDAGALNAEQSALIERITAGPRARQAGTVPLTDASGRLSGVFSLMPIAPAVGDRVQALGAALRFEASLNPLTRELGILLIAARFRSDFEWFAHERAAREAGATAEHLAALTRGEAPTGLPFDTELSLVVLAELLRDGTLCDESYRRAVRELGEQALAELVWLQGYYSMLATALAVFRPQLPSAAYGVLTGAIPTEPEPEP